MIKRFFVSKIFGSRDIEVYFNEDLTLLVGANGTGKTTVLNIISSVATGNIGVLFNYEFKIIELDYEYKKKSIQLKITKSDQKLKLEWRGKTKLIEIDEMRFVNHKRKIANERYPSSEIRFNSDVMIMLEEIANEINLLYLPLSRDVRPFDIRKENNTITSRDYYFETNDSIVSTSIGSIDESLVQVNSLIKEKHRKIMYEYEKLNQDMPKKMIQASLGYLSNPVNDIGSIMSVISELKIDYSTIVDLKRAFYDMNLLETDYEQSLDSFFNNLRIAQKELSSKKNDEERFKYIITEKPNWVSFITNAPLIDNYLKWLDIVQQTNQLKELEYKPIEMFLTIVNDFLVGSYGGKELIYNDTEGKLSFINQDDPIKQLTLDKMSSGEKQIVVFFAYLIFKINPLRGGIYIIDEPELSLHLNWQRKLCKSIMGAAPNLQFIFATHSPEIIGPYRDNCKNLRGNKNED